MSLFVKKKLFKNTKRYKCLDLIPPQIISKRDLIRSAIFLDAVCPLNGFDNPPRLNPYFFNLQFFITFNCDKTFHIIFFFRSTCLTNWFIYLYVYFIRFLDSLNFTLSYFSCHTAVVYETSLKPIWSSWVATSHYLRMGLPHCSAFEEIPVIVIS